VAADPEDGGDTLIRNVGLQNIYTEPHQRRRHYSILFYCAFPLIIPAVALQFDELQWNFMIVISKGQVVSGDT
jgi:hypothetical protein